MALRTELLLSEPDIKFVRKPLRLELRILDLAARSRPPKLEVHSGPGDDAIMFEGRWKGFSTVVGKYDRALLQLVEHGLGLDRPSRAHCVLDPAAGDPAAKPSGLVPKAGIVRVVDVVMDVGVGETAGGVN